MSYDDKKIPIIGISTNKYTSGIGVIRISMGDFGVNCKNIFMIISKRKYFFPKLATKVYFYSDDKIIDEGFILYFPEPNSYTGESVIEIHSHGNFIILEEIISNCIRNFKNIRLANRGEFTYRAFLNKKVDIFKVKEIENKFSSINKFEIIEYLRSKDKAIKILNTINSHILKLRLYIENLICIEEDFKKSEEKLIRKSLLYIKDHILRINFVKNVENKRFRISIVGVSNSGKSTLFNTILKKKVSIVFDKPGTTRDLIKRNLFFGGVFKVSVFDTAGFRKLICDDIEKIGIKKTKSIIKKSNLVIEIIKFKKYSDLDKFKKKDNKKILVINKLDLFLNKKFKNKLFLNKKFSFVSSKYNFGIENLKEKIFDKLEKMSSCRDKNNDLNHNLFICRNKLLKLIDSCLVLNKKKSIDLVSELLGLIQLNLNFFIENKDLVKKILKNFCLGK